MSVNQNIIVVSHRRSGTHLTIDSILNNFECFQHSIEFFPVNLDKFSYTQSFGDVTTNQMMSNRQISPIILKSHTHGIIEEFFKENSRCFTDIINLFDTSKILYVHRDGRDMLVSLYFYYNHLRKKPERILDFGKFIRMQNDYDSDTYLEYKDRISYWKYHIETWLEKPNILLLSFSDLIMNYQEAIKRISEFIDQPMPMDFKDVIRKKNRLIPELLGKVERILLPPKLQRKKYTTVSFRQGIIGDWKQHFSEKDILYFEQIAGETNRRLGYCD